MKNYDLIEKKLKKSGVYPAEYWNPCYIGLKNNDLTFLLSERSLGKTTAMLLYGMMLNREYGTIIHYIRENVRHLNRSYLKTLFSTIIACGYVEKITEIFNDIFYNAQERKWYYRKIDENGEVVDVAKKPFMVGLSCDNSDAIKSSYVCKDADFIIVDEFCSQSQKNYFLDLFNIFSTLVRERTDFKIVFLSNTIDRVHWIFDEFPLRETIDTLEEGDVRRFTSDEGMRFYVEFCYHEATRERKSFVNKHLFGFKNDKLKAIKGGGWQMSNYRHLTSDIDFDYIEKNLAIQTTSGFLSVDIIMIDSIYYVYCHARTKVYDDTIIYSLDKSFDKRKRYAFGNSRFDKLFWNLIEQNKIFYATNRDGLLLDAYIKKCRQERLHINR